MSKTIKRRLLHMRVVTRIGLTRSEATLNFEDDDTIEVDFTK